MMLINEHIGTWKVCLVSRHFLTWEEAIASSSVLLVPYEKHHVPQYHQWMQDPVSHSILVEPQDSRRSNMKTR